MTPSHPISPGLTLPGPTLADLMPLQPLRLPASHSAAQVQAFLQEWHLAGVLDDAGGAWLRAKHGGVLRLPVPVPLPVLPADLPLSADGLAAGVLAGPVVVEAPIGHPIGQVLLAEQDGRCAPDDLAAQVWQGFTAAQRALLLDIHAGLRLGGAGTLAVVGGAVRDLLLGQPVTDLDVVLVGQAVEPLFRRLQAAVGAGSYHPQYGNATLTLHGSSLDLVSARMERYPQPGAAPQVYPATLAQDLWRRDFGLNALALVVSGSGVRLHDPTGGLDDLYARLLRPLHAHSLHEDASRLVRGARLAARLGLSAHPSLLAQVGAALQVAAQTPRLWAELRLALGEARPGQVLRVLEDWIVEGGGAAELLPAGAAALLQRLDALAVRPPDVVYAAALLSLSADPATLAERLGLGVRPLGLLERVASDKVYVQDSPEGVLRQLLYPPRYPPLTGRDLLEWGFVPGPELGQALHHLAALRRAGQLASREDERRAALAWYAQHTREQQDSL